MLDEKRDLQTDEEQDEFEARITKTGCAKFNELVQECYFKHHDWRKCQTELNAFKDCFRRINQHQSKENNQEM